MKVFIINRKVNKKAVKSSKCARNDNRNKNSGAVLGRVSYILESAEKDQSSRFCAVVRDWT